MRPFRENNRSTPLKPAMDECLGLYGAIGTTTDPDSESTKIRRTLAWNNLAESNVCAASCEGIAAFQPAEQPQG